MNRKKKNRDATANEVFHGISPDVFINRKHIAKIVFPILSSRRFCGNRAIVQLGNLF
jgi:hypothetical protein